MTRPPIKHLRWYIAFLLCLASSLNYLDRQTLSVLIGTIKEELHLSNASYGAINAWFLASYGVMYVVSGRIIDLFGSLGFFGSLSSLLSRLLCVFIIIQFPVT